MACDFKVVHLTSAHPRYDTRIFVKMCSSLVTNGFVTSLIVADGLGDESKDGVSIYDVGAGTGKRFARMTKTVARVLAVAKDLDADIYHLHDPELLPAGLKLKKLGKKVIFDAHEDFPKQLLAKPYLNGVTRVILSIIAGYYERWACARFDAVVTATSFIGEKFSSVNPCTVTVNNFPLLREFTVRDWTSREDAVVYVGGISRIRGIEEIVEALEHTDGARLNLAGQFSERDVERSIRTRVGWGKVNELGFLTREQIDLVLARSRAGLVTLHPVVNYIDALPVKMFEYMAAGIPVIASNFKLWREIIEGAGCGICVNPRDPRVIGAAIQYLLKHPDEAEKLGKNGRKAVEKHYNWSIEERKLLDLYSAVLGRL